MIAALFVDPRGAYANLPGVDVWDEKRDARLYAGPWPVVAHPPCGQWGSLKHLAIPGGHGRVDDKDCGPIAVAAVRCWGGVLEHPARSSLFAHCGLPRPGELPDAYGGRTIEVCQVDWGHPARKRTWLYIVGPAQLPPLPSPRVPTHWVSGGRKHDRKGSGGVVPVGIKVCSAQQRRRTPPAFRDFLLAIARSARPRAVEVA